MAADWWIRLRNNDELAKPLRVGLAMVLLATVWDAFEENTTNKRFDCRGKPSQLRRN